MRIPQDATPDVRQAIREVWEELDRLLTKNIDLRGRRLMNAGPSVDARDYVTRAELTGYVAPPVSVSGGGGFSGDVEDGTGKIARLDGSGTFSGNRTVTGDWTFNGSLAGSAFETGTGDVLRADGTTTLAGNRSVSGAWTFTTNPAISRATPTLSFTDSGGDDYSIRCTADAIYIRNVTDAVDVAWFFGGGLGTLNVGISGTDPGSGEANVRILTRATDTPTSGYNWNGTGAAPDGYFKEYHGTQAVVIPFWNT